MDPRRRGRGELDRTPPDYQVVIKFLLMASLLAASTSLQGRSTGCGLMRPSEEADKMRDASRSPVPEDVREPLQSLGLAEEWHNLQKSASRRRGPLVPRVVAVLMFNTLVIWSDMGQAVFDRESRRSCPVLEPVLRAVSGVSEASQPYWGCAAGLQVLTHANVSAAQEPVCIASEAAARGTCLEEKVEGAEVTPWVEAVRWAQLGDSDVPWWAQLAALGLLVAAVVWIPRCPEVLEITCPVLVT